MNNDNNTPPPTLSITDKLYAVNSITNQIPFKLDVDKANYASWCYFFKNHSESFDVITHIKCDSTSVAAFTPKSVEWLKGLGST